MIQSFTKNFDLKRFRIVTQIIFILACIFLIVNLVGKAYSRYEARANISAQASVAFFVIDQGTYENTISLTGLTPSEDAFYYTFNVMNYNSNNKRCNVDLEYTIKFKTTTNLPLSYEIIRNETYNDSYTNLLTNSSIVQDEYGVFYKEYTNENKYSFSHNRNEIDTYTLKVNFPVAYKDSPDLYQGAIELFSIIIDATQVA